MTEPSFEERIKKDFYVDIYTLDLEVVDRCVEYLEGHIIGQVTYDFAEKNCFTICTFELTEDEITEMEDIFQMYDINIT
jgi:hypothetical protein